MARKYNSLYIGDEHLSTEGRSIKHVGLISEYGNINVNKTSDIPLQFTGLDIETNYKTAEMKLLGLWNGESYSYYTNKFVPILFDLVKRTYWKKGANALAYWNKLDPFVLYKQFLLYFEEEKQYYSMKRYSKVGGEWNKLEGKWSIRPVIEVEITRGRKTYRFGIKNVIRSSIQFFFYEMIGNSPKSLDNGKYPISTVWAYDIAPLFKYGLEKEMLDREDLFPYYSKVSEDAHKIDWDRFYTDKNYRTNKVLYSNMLDARAVYDLANLIVNQFKRAFHYYPRNLISSGSIARASIVAVIKHKYESMAYPEKQVDRFVKEEVASIGLNNYRDYWKSLIGEEAVKDMFCLFYEAYSGGYIEAIRYGLIKAGYSSDIASAYIKHLTQLYDLREAKITYGEGEPPNIDKSYCFVRGDVDIPLDLNYFPLTVKHTELKDTNVRASGRYKASYTINEREYLISLGAKFKNETWYNIETTGDLSPLAEVSQQLVDLRHDLIAKNDSAEFMAKTAAASIYGITFEATETFKENDLLEVTRGGYRGGEFLNPLYASWITAETRIQVSKASNCVASNGGSPVLLMTDCVFWEGSKNMLDKKYIRDNKTLGYFETPKPFKEMACLGSGRYSFVDSKEGYVTTKNRGLNVSAIHDPEGVEISTHNWIEALKIAERDNTSKITVNVRTLVSVGMVLHSVNDKYDEEGKLIRKALTVNDLGLVMEETREVDLITGLTKRILTKNFNNIKEITRGSIMTRSIYFATGMHGDNKQIDQTLPMLREEVMKMTYKSSKDRDRVNRSKASYKYNIKNKSNILKTEREKYKYIRDNGFNRDTAKKWCKRSIERIDKELLKRSDD